MACLCALTFIRFVCSVITWEVEGIVRGNVVLVEGSVMEGGVLLVGS